MVEEKKNTAPFCDETDSKDTQTFPLGGPKLKLNQGVIAKKERILVTVRVIKRYRLQKSLLVLLLFNNTSEKQWQVVDKWVKPSIRTSRTGCLVQKNEITFLKYSPLKQGNGNNYVISQYNNTRPPHHIYCPISRQRYNLFILPSASCDYQRDYSLFSKELSSLFSDCLSLLSFSRRKVTQRSAVILSTCICTYKYCFKACLLSALL